MNRVALSGEIVAVEAGDRPGDTIVTLRVDAVFGETELAIVLDDKSLAFIRDAGPIARMLPGLRMTRKD